MDTQTDWTYKYDTLTKDNYKHIKTNLSSLNDFVKKVNTVSLAKNQI